MVNRVLLLFSIIVTLFLSSCGFYKQNIMFQVDQDSNYDTLGLSVNEIITNYKLQVNDKITVNVYTGNGEILIDPERKLVVNQNSSFKVKDPEYLVTTDSSVVLPLVGKVKIEGYTLAESDSVLSEKYNDYYENSFVITKCINRRVTVLGALGGKVVPLENENTTVLEVLALAGGVDKTSKAQNIRLIRGDLSNPEVYILDLSTIKGMTEANLNVKTGDVIYVEPVRKVVSETIQDVSPIISLVTSVITLIFLISSTRR